VITACHTLIYSDDADATRAFLRDVLAFPFVEGGPDGSGWLIFGTGPSELGVHPTGGEHVGQTHSSPRHHAISFQCDDIEATRTELEGRGATFTTDIVDRGYGLVTSLAVPGADDLLLYQPRHALATDL
jgi:catechol 2,3-dioxygenase-like lactoylglutathione lyase family enzyme